LLNFVKEWGKDGVFDISTIQCSMMGELKKIRTLSLKSLIVASLLLEYNFF
jgi:hypothetical protein